MKVGALPLRTDDLKITVSVCQIKRAVSPHNDRTQPSPTVTVAADVDNEGVDVVEPELGITTKSLGIPTLESFRTT